MEIDMFFVSWTLFLTYILNICSTLYFPSGTKIMLMLDFHCQSSTSITFSLIFINASLISIAFICLSHFYCLCSTLYFLVLIFPWDPCNSVIFETGLPFFSHFLQFWQLTFHHLLPSCHFCHNSCFCLVIFLHINYCFIEFFKFIVKYVISIFICSLRTLS